MNDTPRTDAEASDGWSGDAMCVSVDFARTLERELAEVKEQTMDDVVRKELHAQIDSLRAQLEEAKSGSYQIAHKSLLAQLSDVKESLESAKEKYTAEERRRWQGVSADFNRALKERSELLNQLEAANRELNRVHDTLTRFGMGLDGPYRKSINPADERYIADRVVALCESREAANRDAAAMQHALEQCKRACVGNLRVSAAAIEDYIHNALSSPTGKDYVRRDVLKACIPILEAYAALNPRYMDEDGWQDPNGVHETLAAARAELERTKQG